MRLCKIAGCQAISNTLLMSRKATQEKRLDAFLFSMVETRESVAVSVDLPAQKPCWLTLNHSLSAAKVFDLAKIIFSNSFANAFKMLIGRKLLTRLYEALLGFLKINTDATFQS